MVYFTLQVYGEFTQYTPRFQICTSRLKYYINISFKNVSRETFTNKINMV